jgi:hypothetical protein
VIGKEVTKVKPNLCFGDGNNHAVGGQTIVCIGIGVVNQGFGMDLEIFEACKPK